jgi:hypothetical protein
MHRKFVTGKRKSLFFERITTLFHPITYRLITGDGVKEIIVRRWEDKEDGFNKN